MSKRMSDERLAALEKTSDDYTVITSFPELLAEARRAREAEARLTEDIEDEYKEIVRLEEENAALRAWRERAQKHLGYATNLREHRSLHEENAALRAEVRDLQIGKGSSITGQEEANLQPLKDQQQWTELL